MTKQYISATLTLEKNGIPAIVEFASQKAVTDEEVISHMVKAAEKFWAKLAAEAADKPLTADDELKVQGAEAILTALFESLTSESGQTFGRVVERFHELAQIQGTGAGLVERLHGAGGLTVNNALYDAAGRDNDTPTEGTGHFVALEIGREEPIKLSSDCVTIKDHADKINDKHRAGEPLEAGQYVVLVNEQWRSADTSKAQPDGVCLSHAEEGQIAKVMMSKTYVATSTAGGIAPLGT